MNDKRNIFLFVIWSKARKFEGAIREQLARDFKILYETEMIWSRGEFTRRLWDFYGFGTRFMWWNKGRKCGRGPFKVIAIEDDSPVWVERTDTRGQKLLVDDRVYQAKKSFRALTGHSNIVHSSVTAEETAQQTAFLFNCDPLAMMEKLKTARRIGIGQRRSCYDLGDGLCIKCYRSDEEIKEGAFPGHWEFRALRPAVIAEITSARNDERRNTCCAEFRYYNELKRRLPADVFAAFPERLEQVFVPHRGWALVESTVRNHDGSEPKSFAVFYREAGESVRVKALSSFWGFVRACARHSVRFYDPQNLVVQTMADGAFRIRVVDFEPAARTLIPIDSLCPWLVRGKVMRRARRFLNTQLGVVCANA